MGLQERKIMFNSQLGLAKALNGVVDGLVVQEDPESRHTKALIPRGGNTFNTIEEYRDASGAVSHQRVIDLTNSEEGIAINGAEGNFYFSLVREQKNFGEPTTDFHIGQTFDNRVFEGGLTYDKNGRVVGLGATLRTDTDGDDIEHEFEIDAEGKWIIVNGVKVDHDIMNVSVGHQESNSTIFMKDLNEKERIVFFQDEVKGSFVAFSWRRDFDYEQIREAALSDNDSWKKIYDQFPVAIYWQE